MQSLNFTCIDSRIAFFNAIAAGKLTENPSDDNYAGKYMYMHTSNGKDCFKNIVTRKYDVSSVSK